MRRIAAIAFAMLVPIYSASADTITFDDLTSQAPIPDGYHGLNWNTFQAISSSCCGPSGYANGNVSPNNDLFSPFGNPQSFTSTNGLSFLLGGFYLTAAWNDGLNVLVQGYFQGNLIDTANLVVSTGGPTLEALNWSGVDTVMFTPSGGVNHGYTGSGDHFVIDNLVINETVGAVPEASTWAMMLLGFAALGFIGARQARRRAWAA